MMHLNPQQKNNSLAPSSTKQLSIFQDRPREDIIEEIVIDLQDNEEFINDEEEDIENKNNENYEHKMHVGHNNKKIRTKPQAQEGVKKSAQQE
jgi:hypothetical protein